MIQISDHEASNRVCTSQLQRRPPGPPQSCEIEKGVLPLQREENQMRRAFSTLRRLPAERSGL